jgi:hypothetical protein
MQQECETLVTTGPPAIPQKYYTWAKYIKPLPIKSSEKLLSRTRAEITCSRVDILSPDLDAKSGRDSFVFPANIICINALRLIGVM